MARGKHRQRAVPNTEFIFSNIITITGHKGAAYSTVATPLSTSYATCYRLRLLQKRVSKCYGLGFVCEWSGSHRVISHLANCPTKTLAPRSLLTVVCG